MNNLPKTSKQLIAELDKAFPLRNFSPSQTREEIMFECGKRAVVEYLLRVLEEEEEEQQKLGEN